MTSSSTPCRAQDPQTCKYHGPELRAATAATRGDWDEVLTLLLERDANTAVRDAELADFQATFGLPAVPATDSKADLYTMGKKKRIAYLEEQILIKDLNFNRYFTSHGDNDAQMVDVAVAMIAKYTPADTIFDIAAAEVGNDHEFEGFFREPYAHIAAEIVPLWQDTAALLRAPRNMLVPPPVGGHWRVGFKHELAKALADRAKLMSINASYYGWEDYDFTLRANRNTPGEAYNTRPFEIVSVLHAAEDTWGEFEGTFTDGSSHVGISGWGVISNGSVRRFRLEEDFGTLLRDITKL